MTPPGETTGVPATRSRPVHPAPAFSRSSAYKLWALRAAEAGVARTQGRPERERLRVVLPQTTAERSVPAGARHPSPSPSLATCPTLLRTAPPPPPHSTGRTSWRPTALLDLPDGRRLQRRPEF